MPIPSRLRRYDAFSNPWLNDPVFEEKNRVSEIIWFIAAVLIQEAPRRLTVKEICAFINLKRPWRIKKCKKGLESARSNIRFVLTKSPAFKSDASGWYMTGLPLVRTENQLPAMPQAPLPAEAVQGGTTGQSTSTPQVSAASHDREPSEAGLGLPDQVVDQRSSQWPVQQSVDWSHFTNHQATGTYSGSTYQSSNQGSSQFSVQQSVYLPQHHRQQPTRAYSGSSYSSVDEGSSQWPVQQSVDWSHFTDHQATGAYPGSTYQSSDQGSSQFPVQQSVYLPQHHRQQPTRTCSGSSYSSVDEGSSQLPVQQSVDWSHFTDHQATGVYSGSTYQSSDQDSSQFPVQQSVYLPQHHRQQPARTYSGSSYSSADEGSSQLPIQQSVDWSHSTNQQATGAYSGPTYQSSDQVSSEWDVRHVALSSNQGIVYWSSCGATYSQSSPPGSVQALESGRR